MVAEKRRVIVVLGMHRSGTSLLARALNLLGVDLGEDLLPPGPDNPTGYWESQTIMDINETVLATLGMTWDSVLPINSGDWDLPRIKELQLDALEKLRVKFADKRLWGFKDPRTARLLPFWQTIFRHLDVDESYVLTIRNPLSVAKSLASPNRVNIYPPAYRRTGFTSEKAYVLWLEHTLSAFVYTQGKSRVLVDYDHLLASPSAQLRRIVEQLSLPWNEQIDSAIADFESRFLDLNLRHGKFESQDLNLDSNAQGMVASTYEFLRTLALDETPRINSQTADSAKSWLDGSTLLLSLAGNLDHAFATVSANLMKTQQDAEELSTRVHTLSERSEILQHQLDETLKERTDLETKLDSASVQLRERETSFREESAKLNQQVNLADERITALDQQLNLANEQANRANQQLHEIYVSPGWKIIQRYRNWVENQRQAHPRLFNRYERIALWLLRRTDRQLDQPNSPANTDKGNHLARVAGRATSTVAREVDAKSFLILSTGPDVCYRYRAEHQAEELLFLGLTVDARLLDTLDYDRVLQAYNAFILHRVPHTTEIEAFICRANASGKPVIFDTDDLVFNEAVIGDIKAICDYPPEEYNRHLETIRRNGQTLALCDAALVSTEELRNCVKEVFPEKSVYVNRNAVSAEMISRADFALTHVPKIDDGFVRIVYMSGTKTHNEDFAQCVGALERLLQLHPQVLLMIVGLIDLPERLAQWTDRLEIIPLVPFQELPKLMRGADINLAPLEIENAFTRCKSEIKYLEAGLLGLPTVASALPAFTVAITSGDNGFLCRSEQDWFDSLERLALSPELRHRIGSRAREDVLTRYTTRTRAPEFARVLSQIFDNLRVKTSCGLP
jgi:glycosyltransferase involved in cell wall biosynthesis